MNTTLLPTQYLFTPATRLDEITTNYRLGFGAYNEKPIHPFVIPRPPIDIPGLGLIVPTDYSYRHVVSLTANITLFRVSHAIIIKVPISCLFLIIHTLDVFRIGRIVVVVVRACTCK